MKIDLLKKAIIRHQRARTQSTVDQQWAIMMFCWKNLTNSEKIEIWKWNPNWRTKRIISSKNIQTVKTTTTVSRKTHTSKFSFGHQDRKKILDRVKVLSNK